MSNIYIQEPPALGKRTEAQLKKCWDNMKTRKKAQIALEKREKMKNEGSGHQPSNMEEVLSEEALTDVELLVVGGEYQPQQMEDESHDIELEDTPEPEPSIELNEDHVEDTTKARTIRDEFEIRKRNYQRAQEREAELHRLKVREMKLLVLAAEEMYKKARIERQTAEEIYKKSKCLE